jgi:hypothetical protein
MESTRSSAEGTVTPKYVGGIGRTINSDAHSRVSEEKNLELGNPEKVVSTSSFGKGEMENLKIGGVDPVFEAKAAIVNSAFQQIGMGKYQWKLFALCGFGWVPSPNRRF